MKILTILGLVIVLPCLCFGQTNSPNLYSVDRPTYDFRLSRDSALVKVKLLDQNQDLIHVDISLVIGIDTVLLNLDSTDMRTFPVRCGVHPLRFFSNFGYELTTAPLQFPSQSITEMNIMMEGKPVPLPNIWYDL